MLKGVIITLDELGHLQCSYLGTDPTSTVSHIGMGGVNNSNLSLKVELYTHLHV